MSRRRGGTNNGSARRARRRAVEASELAPVDRAAPLRAWARSLHDDVARVESALDAEQVASAAVATWGRGNAYMRDPGETLPELELVDHLARSGDSPALVLLRALGHVAGGEVAAAAGAAADRLAAAGVEGPAWIDAVGAARPVAAWIVRDAEFEDGTALFAEFEMPDGSRHMVSVYVDHNLGDFAKIVGLTHSLADELSGRGALGQAQAVSLAEMGARLRAALDAMPPARRLARMHDDAGRYALARARADALPGGFELPERREITPDDRFALMTRFLDSEEGARYRDDVDAQSAVALAIDFCADHGDGRPLRWSPLVVLRFMGDWLPEHAWEQRDVLEAAPGVLRAWVAYAGRQRGTAADRVADTAAMVDRCREAMLDYADVLAEEAAAAA